MSKQNKTKKVTSRKLMYSIINYFAGIIDCRFDVSSYLLNKKTDDFYDINFLNRKISKFISKNNNNKSTNRLCLAISIEDSNSKDISQSHELLNNLLLKIRNNFWQSEIIDILDNYNSDTTLKILSKENHTTLVYYIIMIFNLPYDSSIEIIISTNRLSKKIICRDEDGDVIDYNKKLNTDIIRFDEERISREISN